jgi:hypothetical protein
LVLYGRGKRVNELRYYEVKRIEGQGEVGVDGISGLSSDQSSNGSGDLRLRRAIGAFWQRYLGFREGKG